MLSRIDETTTLSDIPKKFTNEIYVSEDCSVQFAGYKSIFSIKYVISGIERYNIDGKQFSIKPNQFLVVNNGNEVNCIHSQGKAVSTFLEPDLITDVYRNLASNHSDLLANPFHSSQKHEPLFWESIFNPSDKSTANLTRLLQSVCSVGENENISVETDLFYQIAEKLILSQQESLHQLNSFNAVKFSTRQELYRRLLEGKKYLEDNCFRANSLIEASTSAGLSQFHFHRLFVNAFNITPFKYHRTLRIALAIEKLESNQYEIPEVAKQLGFSDVYSFGRFIKKHTAFTPGQIIRNQKNNKR